MSDFLPIEFENRMRKLLGSDYEEFEASYEKDQHRGLRANLLKKNLSGETALDILSNNPGLKPVCWTDCGFYYEEDSYPGKHPYHEAGVYYIQEPSAMTPGMLIAARPGEKILDLCAAPGGKTTQIAAHMGGKGLLISNEINSQRARILSENVERMGIKNVVVTNEPSEALAQRFENFFDRIMVDAPCSGEGMFRKNDVAISEWSLENVSLCATRQRQILDNAALMLKPGGVIVYSTCTFAPEENELQIADFLQRHSEFEIAQTEDLKEKIGEIQPLNIDAFGISGEVYEKSVRLWPHKINGEGHFAAVLYKKSESEELANFKAEIINDTPISSADKKKLIEYLGDILKPDCFEKDGILGTGHLEFFGENIYLVPSGMTTLKGLKVLRAGLHLGSINKNRFEPSHSLALAICPKDALRVADFDKTDAADFIKGLTKNIDGDKGWTLVCTCGFSLGWGKNAGGILKNHYPKGLRKG